MAGIIDTLSERQITDLMAYAEGTLPEWRRAEVEAWVATSPELEGLVRRQRRSLAATRELEGEATPATLYAAMEAGAAGAARPRRRRLTLAVSAAAVLAVFLVVAVMLGQGAAPDGPTVADAAQLATQPATEAAPSPVPGTGRLDVAVGSLAFPDLEERYGWCAVGARRDDIAGRETAVVYYARGGEQVAYAIVDSPVLARPTGAAATVSDGVEYLSLVEAGYPAVTWRRDGRTCLLVGDLPPERLLTLARWSNGAGY
jgi:anti-sigma factor RsiW